MKNRTDSRKTINKHFHFRNMLVLVVVLVSICVQGIYLGYSQYRFDTFQKKVLDESVETVHQTLLDNVIDVMEQTESLFNFIRLNGLFSYSNNYLNLRDENTVSDMLADMEEICYQFESKSDLVDGFLVIGKNWNQKSLYYDISQKELVEYSAFCQDILTESGFDSEIYQSFGMPARIPESRIKDILKNYDKSLSEYPALVQFAEQCSSHYVMSDIVSEVVIMVFLDETCFETGLDEQSDYGFALLSSNAKPILSYGKVVEKFLLTVDGASALKESKYNGMVRISEVQPEGLWVVTSVEGSESYLQSNISVALVICMLFLNLLTFGLTLIFSKKMIEALAIFKRVMLRRYKKTDVTTDVPERSVPFGRQLFFSLFVSCIIPFVSIVIISSHSINNFGERLLIRYLDACTLRYESVCKRFQRECENLSVSSVAGFINQYDINNFNKNVELIRDFDVNVLSKIDSLPEYSYMLVTDCDYNILYQSMYSGHAELFTDITTRASKSSKTSPTKSSFWVMEDAISNENIVVYYVPVIYEEELVGSVLIAMKETVLDEYMAVEQKNTDYIFVNENGEIFGNKQSVSSIGESVLRSFSKKTKKNKYYHENSLMAFCRQTMFKDTHVLVHVDAEDYIGILDGVLYDSVFISLVFVLVIIIISWIMMRMVLNPIKGMIQVFSQDSSNPEKMMITTGVTEINDLIFVYNTMVEQQEKLMRDNEKRHENEKKLIELQAQTEFQMLQQQINPHFMFNTLEIINLLASVNGMDDISSVAKALAEILRYSLKHSQTVTVGEEIAAVKNYLLIMNMRFGDRIRIVTEFDESLYECLMLKFVLQPLVENAFLHGVHNKLKDGEVKIKTAVQEERFIISVSDNGVGMSQEQIDKLMDSICDGNEENPPTNRNGGIGLKNVYRRLRIFYGEQANMLIDSEHDAGTTVTLVLPLLCE